MSLRVLVFAIACLALVNAYSVTPNFGSNIGGFGSDLVKGLAVDALGSYYVVGSTTSVEVNTTLTLGGPAPTTSNTRMGVFGAGGTSGFVTKYAATGARVWTATAMTSGGASGVAEVTAVTLGAGKVFVCGRYNATVTIAGSSGSMSLPLDAMYDVFAAAFDASTGAFVWAVNAHSSDDDACLAIAYSPVGPAGTVAFAGTMADRPNLDGVTYPTITLGAVNFGALSAVVCTDWIARVDTAGANAGLGSASIYPYDSAAAGGSTSYCGRTGGLDFDANGHLFMAITVVAGSNLLSPAGLSDVFVTSIPNVTIINPSQMTLIGQSGGSDAYFGFDQPTLYSAYMGSVADDIVTGIKVIKSGTRNTTATLIEAMSQTRIALCGYTAGGAGQTFYFRAQNINGDPEFSPHGLNAVVPSGLAPWFAVVDGRMYTTASDVSATFYGTTTLMGTVTGMAYEATSGHFFLSGSWMGAASLTVNGAATTVATVDSQMDAVLLRVSHTGVLQWVEVAGGKGNDTGVATGLVVAPIGFSPLPRPLPFLAGNFVANVTLSGASAAPLTVRQKLNGDVFVASYDDLDDCGLQAGAQPYGPNVCGVTSNFNAIGASLCLDEPGFPLCFCNMNVTDPTGHGLCTSRGWNCPFMAPYYFGLLNVCNCPQLPTPSANPLNDVASRLLLCGTRVCNFATLTGAYASCLPLVLDLISTCGAPSANTSLVDRGYIAAFEQVYANCGTDSGSTGGAGAGSSTGYVFGAAPSTAVASTVVAGAAMFAGVALTAAAVAPAADAVGVPEN